MVTLPSGNPKAEDNEGVKGPVEEQDEEKASHVQNNITHQRF